MITELQIPANLSYTSFHYNLVCSFQIARVHLQIYHWLLLIEWRAPWPARMKQLFPQIGRYDPEIEEEMDFFEH